MDNRNDFPKTSNIIFVTYDLSLKRYLWKNGFDNILYGLNPKTKKMFWVYIRSIELNKMLDQWYIV